MTAYRFPVRVPPRAPLLFLREDPRLDPTFPDGWQVEEVVLENNPCAPEMQREGPSGKPTIWMGTAPGNPHRFRAFRGYQSIRAAGYTPQGDGGACVAESWGEFVRQNQTIPLTV